MKVVHSWLKDYAGESLPSAEKVAELLTFHAFEIEEIEKVAREDVIDVKILPDRGSDCLSHRGIAREIASITGIPLVHDPFLSTERLPLFSDIEVAVADTHACSRFAAAFIDGIEVKNSPQWLQERLQALGQRSINNIVDATNYVMYALGQPLHAYDAEKFPQKDGKWHFDVRFAKEGEEVHLIAEGGKTEDRVVSLQGTELLIVDGSSDTPIGLAGVKGGSYAGVNGQTTKIIVEAAHFDPVVTRKTARRLGIVIDASKRFENNPSPEIIPHALREVAKLICEIAGGACKGSIDVDLEPSKPVSVRVTYAQVNALLGLSLAPEEMIDIVKRIGATVAVQDDAFVATAPFERTDLSIPEDYIEEIGRIHGYQDIVSVVPAAVPLAEVNKRQYYSEKIRQVLFDLGFSEVITSSFRKKDVIKLQNALASDKSYLRSNLQTNIDEALEKNAGLTDLLGTKDTRVFEIGTVFAKEDGYVHEHVSLCLGVRTKISSFVPADTKMLTSCIAELEEILGMDLQFQISGCTAECNLSTVLPKLAVPTVYEPVTVSNEIVYTPFSLYPAIVRDIALWVSAGVSVQEVEAVINEHAGSLRVRTTLFDEFTKEGRTSYAFRLVFQSTTRTLTDDEANKCMEVVYAAVAEKGWTVR